MLTRKRILTLLAYLIVSVTLMLLAIRYNNTTVLNIFYVIFLAIPVLIGIRKVWKHYKK